MPTSFLRSISRRTNAVGRFRGHLWISFFSSVGLLAGCAHEAPPPKKPSLPKVMVAKPVTETLTDFEEYTGRLAPVHLIDVRARVSGYLDAVEFKDGADIEAGTKLFQIDPRPFAATVAEAEAAFAQIESRLERTRRQESRSTQLASQKVTTTEDLELIQFQRMETEAELKAARAKVELAKLDLEFTDIKSPISGRISRRLVDPGNLVLADTTPMATIVSLDPLYAYFDVDERTVLQVRRLIAEGVVTSARDSAIEVELALADDDQQFSLKGRLNFVDNQVSPTTGTLRLRAEIDNPKKLLAPGMFVRVRVPIGQPRSVLLVDEQALGSDQGHRFVYVVNDKNEVSQRQVTPGRLLGRRRVIANGLNADERIVVVGLQRVRPGAVVEPVLQEATPVAETFASGDPIAPPRVETLVTDQPANKKSP